MSYLGNALLRETLKARGSRKFRSETIRISSNFQGISVGNFRLRFEYFSSLVQAMGKLWRDGVMFGSL